MTGVGRGLAGDLEDLQSRYIQAVVNGILIVYNRDAGIRMDHLLLSPNLEKRLKKGGVHRHVRGWEKTSDHAPVWIQITDK